jgi:hypothetical protein
MDTNSTPVPVPTNEALAEKYIRTFAGDINIFQRGGTPGLMPLKSEAPLPAERLVAASPEILEPSSPKTEPSSAMPVPPGADKVAQSEPTVSPLETYAQDFRDHIQETQASATTILAAEQDAAPREQSGAESSRNDNYARWYGIAAVLLFIIGGVGLWLGYAHYRTALAPVISAPALATPIFVDSRQTVPGSGMTVMQSVEESVTTPLASNTVRLLSLPAASSTSVFSELAVLAPGILLRNIDPTRSMAGVVNAGGEQSPFFILSVDSYSATFSGMLEWEPQMQSNLATLFPLYPAPAIPLATSTATTTATTTRPMALISTPSVAQKPVVVFQPGFHDEVVSNHDVRIYRDAQRRSILLYGYWNETTLIIARDPVAFALLLDRLANSHT